MFSEGYIPAFTNLLLQHLEALLLHDAQVSERFLFRSDDFLSNVKAGLTLEMLPVPADNEDR